MKQIIRIERFKKHLTSLNYVEDMVEIIIHMPAKEYYKFSEELNKEKEK